jgi:hypothetical protein
MQNLLLSTLLIILFSCSETKKEQPVSFKPGFKTIHAVDRTRIYKPGTDSTDYLHYRPVDLDIWYPAKVSENDSVLLFRTILSLLEKRAIYYTGSNNWKGITSQTAKSFCDGFKCSDTTRLLDFRTGSYRNAPEIDSKFPLVIYLCAFNGMSYENYALFEKLAEKGFVVVSVSSIGRYPGDMTMKKEDLMEQVYDAIASLETVKKSSNIDFSKIGIIGYSWGGLSGAILSAMIPDVSCLVSLDGSEYHTYGESKEEDEDFNGILSSEEFKKLSLPVTYLRLESSPETSTGKTVSVFNFSEKLTGKKQIIRIDSAKHEDFSCLSEIVRISGNCTTNQHFKNISGRTISFITENLKNADSIQSSSSEGRGHSLN